MRSFLRTLRGAPKYFKDPALSRKMALIPVLAWIGLGGDALSSSSYGPQEAYLTLLGHTYLALALAAAIAFTVLVISYTYTRVIEHFPNGGGGYLVAHQMLGERVGAVSGSALFVDYVLCITVSVASCADALFSYLPTEMHTLKVPFACFLVLFMMALNIRGIKESITVLAPIFLFFIFTHLVLFGAGFIRYGSQIPKMAAEFQTGMGHDLSTIGGFGVLLLFLRAYSFGGGTYTGIEAVSNGMPNIREPKVENGKKTMIYIAASLALTVGALLVCYILANIRPVAGKTLNAVLADAVFSGWPLGSSISFVTLLSEALLLMVGSQTGFASGPQIMSNMAVDSWFPHQFAHLSVRLTMINGVLLMGIGSILLIVYTRGAISTLVVMFSINVFITFTLTQLGMLRLYWRNRGKIRRWRWYLSAHGVGLALCGTVLVITSLEKFALGGWLTYLVTAAVIGFCFLVHGHYQGVRNALRETDGILRTVSFPDTRNTSPPDPEQPTAVHLVYGYNGLGVHTLLVMSKLFPNLYKNVIFVSVAVIDSGTFKGVDSVNKLEESTREFLGKYVDLAQRMGFASDCRMATSTDIVESLADLCKYYHARFPDTTVFSGQLVFSRDRIYHRLLHNSTAFTVQRRLLHDEIAMVILPMRVG